MKELKYSIVSFLIFMVCASFLYAETFPSTVSYGISFQGDLKYPSYFSHYDYVNPQAPKGGVIKLGRVGTFDSLNLYSVQGVPAHGLWLVLPKLFSRAADEPFSLYGLLAQQIEFPPDRSWALYTLRPEAKWEDGTPLTADDVIFSYQMWTQKGPPFLKGLYRKVEKAEKISGHKVKFYFKNNTEGIDREMPLLVGMMPIASKVYSEKHPPYQASLISPLSSGPYRIKEVKPGRLVIYERIKNYWGKDLPVNKGRYNFDEVQIHYYRNKIVLKEAFKKGEIDVLIEEDPQLWIKDRNYPAAKQGKIKFLELEHNRPVSMKALAFNTRNPLFSRPAVRQALNVMFDFERMNQAFFQNQYTRIQSYFENTELAAHGKPQGQELEILKSFQKHLDPKIFTQNIEEVSAQIPDQRLRFQKAQKILAAENWKVKDGLLIHPTLGTLEFEILLPDSDYIKFVASYIRDLKKIGILAKVRVIEPLQYEERKSNFKYDMIIHEWKISRSPGNQLKNYWSSEAANIPGSRNYAGIQHPVIDELIQKLLKACDRSIFVATSQAIDRILCFQNYVVPLFYLKKDLIAHWDKFGYPLHAEDLEMHFVSWWKK
jgi:microcin C transport system substrate-binding protein